MIVTDMGKATYVYAERENSVAINYLEICKVRGSVLCNAFCSDTLDMFTEMQVHFHVKSPLEHLSDCKQDFETYG